MNTKSFHLIAAALFVSIIAGRGQGTFVNMDFESPVLPLIAPLGTFRVAITNALPHWAAYIDDVPQDRVVFNTIALDNAAISLHDSRSIYGPAPQGNYSVYLQPSSPFASQQASAALAQTGMVPQDARSLLLYAKPSTFPFLTLQVTFAGQTISMMPVGAATATYQVWGGDISPHSGQSGELRFTVTPHAASWLDNIQFSSDPVPEPGTWALFGLGSALLCCVARRKRK